MDPAYGFDKQGVDAIRDTVNAVLGTPINAVGSKRGHRAPQGVASSSYKGPWAIEKLEPNKIGIKKDGQFIKWHISKYVDQAVFGKAPSDVIGSAGWPTSTFRMHGQIPNRNYFNPFQIYNVDFTTMFDMSEWTLEAISGLDYYTKTITGANTFVSVRVGPADGLVVNTDYTSNITGTPFKLIVDSSHVNTSKIPIAYLTTADGTNYNVSQLLYGILDVGQYLEGFTA